MSLFDAIFAAKPAYGTPPFAGGHPQTGGAQVPTTPETLPAKRGFAGFIDRALNPTNALGQFGQALVASGGGPLGDAMAYMMKARMLRENQKAKGPHFEHIGDSFGIVDDNTGQFTPTYTAPKSDPQPDDFTRQMAAAGIDPTSDQGKALFRQHVTNIADPVVNLSLPGGAAYIGPRSGMAAALGQPTDPAPADAMPGGLAPKPAAVASTLAKAGLPAHVVAGFLGNFDAEGGYDGALGDGGSAQGIAQWRGDRVAQFRNVIGKDPAQASPEEQARFVAWEMQNPQAAGMTPQARDAILGASSAPQAAGLIDQYYERSSGTARGKRMAAATNFASALGSDGVVSVSTPEEASALPPGTTYRTPDGRTFKR